MFLQKVSIVGYAAPKIRETNFHHLWSKLLGVPSYLATFDLDRVIDTILPLEKKGIRLLAKREGRTGRVNARLHKLKDRDAGEGP